ncbi:LysR family transcriptional regulator [Marinicella sp. W31]|uniref:LysR family transcriptional regulator n=1 Tax=Marinicella sp. W31 TaxID=3023713 RepID=UPI00375731CE
MVAAIQVAEVGSFAEASRLLGLSTSATSKAVSRLEEELGVKLFHRTTRSISLTPEGERYVEGLRPLLLEIDVITAEVTDSLAIPKGLLRVSVPAAYGRMKLIPKITEFLTLYPEINLEISLDDRVIDLAAEHVDVAIRAGILSDSSNIVGRKLFDDPFVTCASPTYLKKFGKPSSPTDLVHHHCLLFRNRHTGRVYPWLYKNDFRIDSKGPLTIDDGESVQRAAIAGAGISQMPGFMAEEALANGTLEEVLSEFKPNSLTYTAVYLDRKLVSPRIRAFIDFLIKL